MPRRVISANLLVNGDFENAPAGSTPVSGANAVWVDNTTNGSSTNDIYKWAINRSGPASLLFDSTEKHSGSYSLKAAKTAATTGSAEGRRYTSSATNLKLRLGAAWVRPSTQYHLSYWMKTRYVSGDTSAATAGARCPFVELSGAASSVATTQITPIKVTTGWTLYQHTITTNASTRFIEPRPSIFGNSGGSTDLIMDAWFDDIKIVPATAVTRTAIT